MVVTRQCTDSAEPNVCKVLCLTQRCRYFNLKKGEQAIEQNDEVLASLKLLSQLLLDSATLPAGVTAKIAKATIQGVLKWALNQFASRHVLDMEMLKKRLVNYSGTAKMKLNAETDWDHVQNTLEELIRDNPSKVGGRCCLCIGASGDAERGLCWRHLHVTKAEICNLPSILFPEVPAVTTLASKGRTRLSADAFSAQRYEGAAFEEVAHKRELFNKIDKKALKDFITPPLPPVPPKPVPFTFTLTPDEEPEAWKVITPVDLMPRPRNSNNLAYDFPKHAPCTQGQQGATRFLNIALLKGMQSLKAANNHYGYNQDYRYNQLQVRCGAILPGDYGLLQPYQVTAKFLLSPEMEPMIKYMLFAHGVGTGKTLSMITILDSFYFDTRPKIAVFPNAEVRDNFYRELCKWGSKYREFLVKKVGAQVVENCANRIPPALDTVQKALGIVRFSSRAAEAGDLVLHAPVRAYTYEELLQHSSTAMFRGKNWSVGQMRDKNILNEKIILFDEAHNMLEEQLKTRERENKYFSSAATRIKQIREELLTLNRRETVMGFFTATPMIESPSQLSDMIKIVRGNRQEEQAWDEGYVSYFIARPDETFPKHIPGGYVPCIKTVPITGEGIVQALSLMGKVIKIGTDPATKALTSIGIINGDVGKRKKQLTDEEERNALLDALLCPPEAKNSLLMKILLAVKEGDDAPNEKLEAQCKLHAPKLWQIAQDCVAEGNSEYKTLIIMSERGIKTLTLMIRYLANQLGLIPNDNEDTIEFDYTNRGKDGTKVSRYKSKVAHMILTSTGATQTDLSMQVKKTAQFEDESLYPIAINRVFEKPNNIRGAKMRVLIVNAKFFSEGVSFNHVRRVILASVPPSYSAMIQRVARASRACVHLDFPEKKDRKLYVDMYVNVITQDDIQEVLFQLNCKKTQLPALKKNKYGCVAGEKGKLLNKTAWVKAQGVKTDPPKLNIPPSPAAHKTKRAKAAYEKEFKDAHNKAKRETTKQDKEANNTGYEQYKKSVQGNYSKEDYDCFEMEEGLQASINLISKAVSSNTQKVSKHFSNLACMTPDVVRLLSVLNKKDRYELSMCALYKTACDSSVLLKFMGSPGDECKRYEKFQSHQMSELLRDMGTYDPSELRIPYGAYDIKPLPEGILSKAPVVTNSINKANDRPTDLDIMSQHYYNELDWYWLAYIERVCPNVISIWPSEASGDALDMSQLKIRMRKSLLIYSDQVKQLWRNDTLMHQLDAAEERNPSGAVLVPFTIVTAAGGLHSNGLVFNFRLNTLIHFEPHGHSSSYDTVALKRALSKLANDANLRFEDPQDYCPRVGLQTLSSSSDYYETRPTASSNNNKNNKNKKNAAPAPPKEVEKFQRKGICMVYTMMFLHLQLLNLDKPPAAVYAYLNSHPREIEQLAYGYMQHMADMKQEHDLVKVLLVENDRHTYRYKARNS